MPNLQDPDDTSSEEALQADPQYWSNAFCGTPLAIVVPPYIRFQQGQIALRRALHFLLVARGEAQAGNPRLKQIFEEMNSSNEAKQSGLSFESYFASVNVIALVSEVEHFLANAVSMALRLYPGKMASYTFSLSEILTVSSTDELIERAASSKLQDLMYEKPLDYLAGLCNILSIQKQSLELQWPSFVELKARRDLGVHNDWTVNAVYLRKVKEAKVEQLPLLGTRLIPDFKYLLQSMELCYDLISKLAYLLGEKWIPIAKNMSKESGADSESPNSGSSLNY